MHDHKRVPQTRRRASTRYCIFDAAHKDYLYTHAWVDHLVKTLSEDATYDFLLGMKKSKTVGRAGCGRTCMIPKECKRLAEVDFPIAVVSKHAAREKSIRHGHPSTLHLWWARRPLASSRAVLLALLWPDPCDPLCPMDFKVKARQLLPQLQGQPGPTDEDLRKALLKFIGDFANWDLAANRNYLEVSRALVKAAHGEEAPLVVDPFAGGGSIPLEALRLGCDALANDLNPVPALILETVLEHVPRFGPDLATELRAAGAEIRKAASNELAEFFPPGDDDSRPIAYLWARTVRCEAPRCGLEIPLFRTGWVCRTPSRRVALRWEIIKGSNDEPSIAFLLYEPEQRSQAIQGTVSQARATCPACNATMSRDRLRAQLASRAFGANDARLLVVVATTPGQKGRQYRLPTKRDLDAFNAARKRILDFPPSRFPTSAYRDATNETLGSGQFFTGRKRGINSFPIVSA